MRILKLITAGLFAALAAAVAILAGVFAAAVVAGIGLVVYLTRRVLGRGQAPAPRMSARPRSQPMHEGDAIDIAATEVPSTAEAGASTGDTRALPER